MTAIEKAIAALESAIGCFTAAHTEGLLEVLANEENKETGSLHDLVTRRILYAYDNAQEALSELRAEQGEKVEIDKEKYLIALCAWNNVPLDNAAMIKYTEENFGKVATDGGQRVYDAIAAKLQLERQRDNMTYQQQKAEESYDEAIQDIERRKRKINGKQK